MEDSPQAPFFINEMSAYGREPRLHDLRHTWATRCPARIYESGQDSNAALPVLATYLGHVNIACITIYLHPSAELLAQAVARFTPQMGAVMNEGKSILFHVQAFFQDYLASQRGLSQNTILAYRGALKLFIAFLVIPLL